MVFACDPRHPAMNPRNVQEEQRTHGDVLTAISDGMVALLKEFYGHGPARTKSYYEDDLVVCVLRGSADLTGTEIARASPQVPGWPNCRPPLGFDGPQAGSTK